MNDLDMLIDLVEHNPDAMLYQEMLTDELMERRDMIRSEADRHAHGIAKKARDARDLTDAAAIMTKPTAVTRATMASLIHTLGERGDRVNSLILIPGESGPETTAGSIPNRRGGFYRIMWVGATYYLRVYQREVKNALSRKATRRRRSE